ncbi:MAG TPA: ACP S-malonyltransferase, partial [Acidimicrobiales bacterium]|nr:ACP S-malonyltransferase [Acidimicrobiales bacterium]
MLVFTFPGQGSQRPGMGAAWVDHPSWELVSDASEAAGRDIARLLLEADKDELTSTRNAQLATFTLSMVVLDAIERLGLAPSACAGHSLGEYSALVAAGALAFEDGVRLVTERGEAMQAAADERPGTMSAVLGLDDDAVEVACLRAESEVWVANYNAPGQVVVAGTVEGVAAASELAKEAGARRVMGLPVGGAFHTPLMAPARSHLRKALADATFYAPEVPVTANVDARVHTGADEWASLLSAQLCSPVRWAQTVESLASADPGTSFVEVGPGGVLSALVRRIAPGAKAVSVAGPDDLDALVGDLAGTTPLQAYLSEHHGEHLYVSERVVVSPATGLYRPPS